MNKNPAARIIRSPLAAAIIVGAGLVAGNAMRVSARPAPAPAASSVAIVDLATLMDGLEELKQKNAEVGAKGAQYQKQISDLNDQIKQVEQDLDVNIPKDDAKRRVEALGHRAELISLRDARKNGLQAQFDLEKGDVLRSIYNKSLAAVDTFARQEGYDYVLLNDTSMTLPPGATFRDYSDMIERRRILYARQGVDVTDRIVTIMNNDYAAANPGKK